MLANMKYSICLKGNVFSIAHFFEYTIILMPGIKHAGSYKYYSFKYFVSILLSFYSIHAFAVKPSIHK